MAVTIAAVRPIHPKVSPFPGPTGQAMRSSARNTLWNFYYGAVRHKHTYKPGCLTLKMKELRHFEMSVTT